MEGGSRRRRRRRRRGDRDDGDSCDLASLHLELRTFRMSPEVATRKTAIDSFPNSKIHNPDRNQNSFGNSGDPFS